MRREVRERGFRRRVSSRPTFPTSLGRGWASCRALRVRVLLKGAFVCVCLGLAGVYWGLGMGTCSCRVCPLFTLLAFLVFGFEMWERWSESARGPRSRPSIPAACLVLSINLILSYTLYTAVMSLEILLPAACTGDRRHGCGKLMTADQLRRAASGGDELLVELATRPAEEGRNDAATATCKYQRRQNQNATSHPLSVVRRVLCRIPRESLRPPSV